MAKNFLFTSESVSHGHPDKVCDQISDALVDAYLAEDPQSRLAIETFATTNRVIIGGEIRAPEIARSKIEEIIRGVVKKIGYNQKGFNYRTLEISNFLHEQSVDIARGVDAGVNKEEGAGDQGIMFGYACDETVQFMPAPIFYAHRLLENIMAAVKSGQLPNLGPDAKSQITLNYVNSRPVGVKSVLVSIQHPAGFAQEQIKELLLPFIKKTLPEGWMCSENEVLVNPTGQFIIGGPDGDAGLTGRKIIVDTYGGAAPHGGGAFSGKDPTKVDRSAAYMARYLAKNVVAAKLAVRCTIQLSYAIGLAQPLSVYVNLHNSSAEFIDREEKIIKFIKKNIDLSPKGIRGYLGLNRPIYEKTASYGHFGRDFEEDGSFSWEKIDLVDKFYI